MIADFKQPAPLPKIGRKTKIGRKKPRTDHCVNSGAPATGRFCAECGQELKDPGSFKRPWVVYKQGRLATV